MKRKEIINLAKKIAQQELILQKSDDPKARARAESEIIKLSACVQSFEDMVALDDAIQDILEKIS